jgi:hypothetical protein
MATTVGRRIIYIASTAALDSGIDGSSNTIRITIAGIAASSTFRVIIKGSLVEV